MSTGLELMLAVAAAVAAICAEHDPSTPWPGHGDTWDCGGVSHRVIGLYAGQGSGVIYAAFAPGPPAPPGRVRYSNMAAALMRGNRTQWTRTWPEINE